MREVDPRTPLVPVERIVTEVTASLPAMYPAFDGELVNDSPASIVDPEAGAVLVKLVEFS
jgi:hypothetical protein